MQRTSARQTEEKNNSVEWWVQDKFRKQRTQYGQKVSHVPRQSEADEQVTDKTSRVSITLSGW